MPSLISRFSYHALQRAQEMNLTVGQLQDCLLRPSAVMGSSGKYHQHGCRTYHRGGIGVVVSPDGTAVTVLYSRQQGEDRFDRDADNGHRVRASSGRLRDLTDDDVWHRYRLCAPQSDTWKRLRQELRRRGLKPGSER